MAPEQPRQNTAMGHMSVNHLQDKQEANQVPYEVSSDLEEAKADFVAHYNHRRYHNP